MEHNFDGSLFQWNLNGKEIFWFEQQNIGIGNLMENNYYWTKISWNFYWIVSFDWHFKAKIFSCVRRASVASECQIVVRIKICPDLHGPNLYDPKSRFVQFQYLTIFHQLYYRFWKISIKNIFHSNIFSTKILRSIEKFPSQFFSVKTNFPTEKF